MQNCIFLCSQQAWSDILKLVELELCLYAVSGMLQVLLTLRLHAAS